MATILGIDYGEKRIGCAVADTETMLAVPVGVITSESQGQAIEAIRDLIHEKRAMEIVVGIPLAMSGSDTSQTKRTRTFIQTLKKSVNLPVRELDERLTTVQARKGGKDKATIDERAATLILQSYLDRLDR